MRFGDVLQHPRIEGIRWMLIIPSDLQAIQVSEDEDDRYAAEDPLTGQVEKLGGELDDWRRLEDE